MKKGIALLVLVLLGSLPSFAQTIKDFKLLKGQTEVEVVFNYENLRMMKDNLTEEQYVVNHSQNLEKKDEGSSAVWVRSWNRSKEDLWNPKFIQLANKYTDKKVKFKDKAPSSIYILFVDVLWIYPGWDAGIMKQGAKVTSTLRLVHRDNPTLVLAQESFENMPGNQFGSNYNNELRIAEGFAKTGKVFAKKIVKSI